MLLLENRSSSVHYAVEAGHRVAQLVFKRRHTVLLVPQYYDRESECEVVENGSPDLPVRGDRGLGSTGI